MILYEIADYDKRYKPKDTKGKDLVNASYVKLPVKPRGKGLKALMKYKKGGEFYGIWCLLLQAATELNPEHRGKLLNYKDEPATIEEIAEAISYDGKGKLVEEAISAFVTIGWVNSVVTTEEVRSDYGQGTEEVRSKCSVVESREEKSRVGKVCVCEFEKFWKAYPDRNGQKKEKKKAIEEWNKLKPDAELQFVILKAIEKDKAARKQAKSRKEFYSAPKDAFRWLRDTCWIDDVEDVTAAGRKEKSGDQIKIYRKNQEDKIRNEETSYWEKKTDTELEGYLKDSDRSMHHFLFSEILAKRS